MAKPKFKINDSYNSPLNDNYDILGFHKFEYIEMTDPAHKGELVKVEYYRNLNGDPNDINQYSDLILTEYREFTRDINTALIIYRKLKVDWYLEDGTIGESKTSMKYYQIKDAIQEGTKRRDNITSAAKLYLLKTIGLYNGQALISDLTPYINTYLQGNHKPLIDAVTNSLEPFMTDVIKQTTVSILTF
jgi:hypothetical protein